MGSSGITDTGTETMEQLGAAATGVGMTSIPASTAQPVSKEVASARKDRILENLLKVGEGVKSARY
jgi:hypothetical protein